MDDLIERCGEQHGMCLVGDDCGNLHTMWEAETALIELHDRIAALEADNARLMGLVKEAGEALSEYACHGGPDLPCIRSKDQCRTECGKIAGDALAKIKEATDGRVTD